MTLCTLYQSYTGCFIPTVLLGHLRQKKGEKKSFFIVLLLFFVLKRGNDITERVCLDPHDCLSWSVLKILELPFFHIKII